MALLAGDSIVRDLEQAGTLGLYAPPEGGYEGRYQRRLRNAGYDILVGSARGMGDVTSYLTGIHGVRPPHLGKQAVRVYFLPPQLQYRLASLPPKAKGLVVWLTEGKFLSKQELGEVILAAQVDPRVKIVVELGSDRVVRWQPLAQAIAAA